MSPVLSPPVALGALVFASLAAAGLRADPPAIETLIAGVPRLAPDNERLDRFRFTLESPLPFEVTIAATLAWNRPHKYGMVVVAGAERTPVWFLSQEKSMMFDVTRGTAVLGERAGPQFVVRADEERVTIKYSLTSPTDAEVDVDLPSFLGRAVRHGTLEADAAGFWRVTTLSESGKSKVIAVFQNSEKFPIRRLEMRSSPDDALAFAVRDIAVNADAHPAWTDFPAAEAFPQGLELKRTSELKVESAGDGIEVVAQGIRTLAAQGALRNPKWRNIPYLVHVDWTQSEKNNERFGPPLRKLLGVTAGKPSREAEPADGAGSAGGSPPPER